ncbi:hypothetical protein [Syntrophomonas wolfei]|uniref:Uncharacterized protein n=1 Tax=Syntrophomonas wolfei TaxID=863 RepID=A0A354YW35_9FIRM|nr:hypothetical protein [Syntrophomonas wolfei]HBK53555.1 hypothetical protein [Syntrophomonas wolfei]
MRTLIATVLTNSKGKDIYCAVKKLSDAQLDIIRKTSRLQLEEAGFTFIRLLSLEYPEVKGHAIFFEGHFDEMLRVFKSLEKGYLL